jgi:hypothetical protein
MATAFVLEGGGYAGSYLVMDLSQGGALLAGDARLTVGNRVSMLLRLPRAEPIAVAARIVRQEVRTEGPCFAVAFDASRATEDRIERAQAAPVGREVAGGA